MKIKSLIVVLVLALFLAAAGVGLSRSSGAVRPRSVIGAGASDLAGGEHITLRATLGQPIVGVVASSGGQGIILGQGFWHGAMAGHDIYLPLVLR